MDDETAVEWVLCARCQRHVLVREAVEGKDLDGDLFGMWFCPECAEALSEPPAMPRLEVAV